MTSKKWIDQGPIKQAVQRLIDHNHWWRQKFINLARMVSWFLKNRRPLLAHCFVASSRSALTLLNVKNTQENTYAREKMGSIIIDFPCKLILTVSVIKTTWTNLASFCHLLINIILKSCAVIALNLSPGRIKETWLGSRKAPPSSASACFRFVRVRYASEISLHYACSVFNPFTPYTEVQNRRTEPLTTTPSTLAVTINGTFTMTPNQIANTAGPDVLFPVQGDVNGWILLVGILGGTIVLVTLVWNSMKLWCRKCEREACRQPPTITYLTPDQALSNDDTNRLAEVPVMAINTFHLETGVRFSVNVTQAHF